MGLSIHYNGKFSRTASLSKMIGEVRDIVEARNWKYHVFETEFPDDPVSEEDYNDEIYGISFSPPGCETVSICFLSNRRMSDIVMLRFWGKSSDTPNGEYLYMLAVKTQYAGEETHKFIVELFRYLKNQGYFEKFEMSDEGQYWETKDENLLHDTFTKYNMLLDNFAIALESIPIKKGESFEKYFMRIIERIQNKNNGKLT